MAFSAGTTVCDYKKITLSKYSFWYWSCHMNFSLIKPLTLTALALVFSGAAIASDQSTYTAWSSQRGNTVNIPEARVAQLCGDIDGCEVRIAMYNWDGSGRTAHCFTTTPATAPGELRPAIGPAPATTTKPNT
jgi:hypothetical protein